MIPGLLLRAFDRFRGAGDAAVTIPSLDGAFRPNQELEEASLLLTILAPDNLVATDGRLLFSSGAEVFELKELSDGDILPTPVAEFDSDVASRCGTWERRARCGALWRRHRSSAAAPTMASI